MAQTQVGEVFPKIGLKIFQKKKKKTHGATVAAGARGAIAGVVVGGEDTFGGAYIQKQRPYINFN